jgi:hypothetical protein
MMKVGIVASDLIRCPSARLQKQKAVCARYENAQSHKGSGVYIRRAGHPMHASSQIEFAGEGIHRPGKSLSPLDLQPNLFVRRKLD